MTSTQPWHTLLRTPTPCDHVVQLYTDEAFLARAVGHFLHTGLAAGAAAVVIATPHHTAAIVRALADAGVDVPAAEGRRQFVPLDARRCLASFMVDGMPDRTRFFGLVSEVLDAARDAGYGEVRLFGEMVELLWDHNLPATIALEELWTEVLTDRRASLLCAYGIDNFDRGVHRGVLHEIAGAHTHLIPVEDYERLERAVARAYRDVFGVAGEPAALRAHVVAGHRETTRMPSAQTALVALRGLGADIADAVLERARRYYEGSISISA
jgi:hypothetical protein